MRVNVDVTSPVPFSGIGAVFEFAPIVPVIFPFALAIDNPLGNEPVVTAWDTHTSEPPTNVPTLVCS